MLTALLFGLCANHCAVPCQHRLLDCICPVSNLVLQGVGVGLFRDRGCAVEACNKLSGAQADGRKLELVLMNPDNHVSFSCRQVGAVVHRS